MKHKTLFTYEPDKYFYFGELLGEHPVRFMAWIDDSEPNTVPLVTIFSITITPTFLSKIEWDITEAIKRSPAKLSNYEDEVLQAYLKIKTKEFNEEIGA